MPRIKSNPVAKRPLVQQTGDDDLIDDTHETYSELNVIKTKSRANKKRKSINDENKFAFDSHFAQFLLEANFYSTIFSMNAFLFMP